MHLRLASSSASDKKTSDTVDGDDDDEYEWTFAGSPPPLRPGGGSTLVTLRVAGKGRRRSARTTPLRPCVLLFNDPNLVLIFA